MPHLDAIPVMVERHEYSRPRAAYMIQRLRSDSPAPTPHRDRVAELDATHGRRMSPRPERASNADRRPAGHQPKENPCTTKTRP